MRRLGARVGGLLAGGEEDGDGCPAPGGGELGVRGEADGVRLGGGGDVARRHLPGVRMRLGELVRKGGKCLIDWGVDSRQPAPWASGGCGEAQHIWGAETGLMSRPRGGRRRSRWSARAWRRNW